jgi:energy-coupling factor transport system permease protein
VSAAGRRRALGAGDRFAYRRLASPLHAARAPVGAAYGLALATAALVLEHPLALAGLAVAVVAAGVAAGVGTQLWRTLRVTAIPLVLLTVLVNLLVDRNGLTVFARLGDWGPLGQVDLTVEALIFGLVMALRLCIVMLAASLVVCAVDPDELLRSLRGVSHRSALTAALSTRLVPLLFDDAHRLAEAQRCRPDGGAAGTRGRLAVLRAVVANALERSLDVAAALELRGYGRAGRPRGVPRPWSRHDLAFAAAAFALLTLAIVAAGAGLAPFTAYPLVHAPLGAGLWALVGLEIVLALAPFADRRGIEP